jgi:hypothetical protein
LAAKPEAVGDDAAEPVALTPCDDPALPFPLGDVVDSKRLVTIPSPVPGGSFAGGVIRASASCRSRSKRCITATACPLFRASNTEAPK